MSLNDTFDRKIKYLRVSVTDLCNLNCRYCNPIDNKYKLSHKEILSFEEIIFFIEQAIDLGIEKLRISGGEPLVRKDIDRFIKKTKHLNLTKKSITTNGILLDRYLPDLIDSGFTSINISLDTLNKEKFKLITGKDFFDTVIKNIHLCINSGIKTKVNSVVMEGINDDEIKELACLSKELPLDVRFIELMPFKNSKGIKPVNAFKIWDKIKELGNYETIKNNSTDGPAQRIKIKGFKGETGVIASLSMHFCSSCNRIRLSSNGNIIPCLLGKTRIDAKQILRSQDLKKQQKLKELIIQAVKNKPQEHHYSIGSHEYVESAMFKIGG